MGAMEHATEVLICLPQELIRVWQGREAPRTRSRRFPAVEWLELALLECLGERARAAEPLDRRLQAVAGNKDLLAVPGQHIDSFRVVRVDHQLVAVQGISDDRRLQGLLLREGLAPLVPEPVLVDPLP